MHELHGWHGPRAAMTHGTPCVQILCQRAAAYTAGKATQAGVAGGGAAAGCAATLHQDSAARRLPWRRACCKREARAQPAAHDSIAQRRAPARKAHAQELNTIAYFVTEEVWPLPCAGATLRDLSTAGCRGMLSAAGSMALAL